MRIKEFSIDNLYYEYNFSSSLDEKVNIFVGNNGSFKTAVMNIIRFLANYGEVPMTEYESATLSFENGIDVISRPSGVVSKSNSWRSVQKKLVSLILRHSFPRILL